MRMMRTQVSVCIEFNSCFLSHKLYYTGKKFCSKHLRDILILLNMQRNQCDNNPNHNTATFIQSWTQSRGSQNEKETSIRYTIFVTAFAIDSSYQELSSIFAIIAEKYEPLLALLAPWSKNWGTLKEILNKFVFNKKIYLYITSLSHKKVYSIVAARKFEKTMAKALMM